MSHGRAYYNEHDPFAAAWLRELIAGGFIPAGVVDTRDIRDVCPVDLRDYAACHFFAGIGGWAYALRLAGWPDDRPVWTGSCPCQPFSSAGQGVGGTDPRHLWPAWFRLIAECRPNILFGEQVESAIGHGWIDVVCDDLEREGYAAGAVSLPAACVGAPHIRQRVWFVADDEGRGTRAAQQSGQLQGAFVEGEGSGRLADSVSERRIGKRLLLRPEEKRRHAGAVSQTTWSGEAGELANTARGDQRRHSGESRDETGAGGSEAWPADGDAARSAGTVGFWDDAEWIYCRDGKSRPVEPGTFPLAHGVPARVGRLRGYGNAIVPQVAAEFIVAACEAKGRISA